MDPAIVAVLVLSALPLIMIVMLLRELQKAKWTLMDVLVGSIILGHVVIIPMAIAYHQEYRDKRLITMAIVGALSCAFAMAMAYGTLWIFRCLHSIGERRPAVRIGYMVLGFFSIPLIFVPPLNILIWRTLIELYRKAKSMDPAAPRIELFEST